MNYYNEIDPKAAAWLRELIAQGHIPAGEVDTRSITEISPDELSKYTQCHFFAGIGGWSLALELAGWPATRPVWTGSCPCQPFSAAGQGKGGSDDRHLWPVFRRLIAKLHPERVFGEQVAQAIGFNWLDGVSADLEADGYAVGAVVLGAHSVGAPHIRQRLFWLANSNREGHGNKPDGAIGRRKSSSHSATGGLGDTGLLRCNPRQRGNAGSEESARCKHRPKPDRSSGALRLGDSNGAGFREQCWPVAIPQEQPAIELRSNAWDSYEILPCRDGKARRIESGSFPLADGLPGRVGLLRGYGNAIVPQTAAEFIRAVEEVISSSAPVTRTEFP
jgi:DNA (cytosine-5)-methyltransferase 1